MARPSSSDRARRLIALLGRLQPDTEISLSDLSSELGVSEETLAEDLGTLSLCGIAPYDPLGLVPVLVEDGLVRVFGEIPALSRPVRLTAAEAGALAAVLEAAGYAGTDPLPARLLAAAGRGVDADELRKVVLAAQDSHRPEVYEALASAIDESRLAKIEHHGATGAATCRVIEPYALFAERGCWYVTAWCRSAEAWRTFRLDRIASVRTLEPHAREREDVPPPCALDSSELPRATLKFAEGTSFVEREWPGGRAVGEADGTTLAEVPYAGTDWIARRVLARFGDVEIVSPHELREAVQALGESELRRLS